MTITITADAATKSVTRSETVTLGEWRPFGTWFVRYWSNKEIAAQAWSDHSWGAYAPWVHDGEDVRIIDGSHRGPHSPSATIEQAKERADAALSKWLEQMSAGSFARLAARTQRDGQTADVVRAK